MGKKTKLAILIGAIAAVVSAVVVVIVFWDKLMEKLPCFCCCDCEEDYEIEDEEDVFAQEELADFADVEDAE